jgi:hypothetical protein
VCPFPGPLVSFSLAVLLLLGFITPEGIGQ